MRLQYRLRALMLMILLAAFASAGAVMWRDANQPSVKAVDVDGDGDADLFVADEMGYP